MVMCPRILPRAGGDGYDSHAPMLGRPAPAPPAGRSAGDGKVTDAAAEQVSDGRGPTAKIKGTPHEFWQRQKHTNSGKTASIRVDPQGDQRNQALTARGRTNESN